MIVKPFSIPIEVTLIEASLSRLGLDHPMRPALESELGRRRAGYRGEQSVHSILAILPKNEYFIFHDLRLPSNPHFFQMDLLILSTSFFLILEVKNMAGELFFDDTFKQIIRTLNDQNDAFDDPILQVRQQRIKLLEWLSMKKIPLIPIETLVVSANSKAVLRAENKDLSKIIVRKNSLILKIEEIKEKHRQEITTKKELKKVINSLLKAHTPHLPKILEYYNILPNDLATGVQCPNCAALPMTRKCGKWLCSRCSYSARDAHLMALRDYALLIKPTITNRELRKFLHVESDSVALKMLRAGHFPHTGSTKNRVYHLEWRD